MYAVLVSKDGSRAIELTEFHGTEPVPNRSAVASYYKFRAISDAYYGRVEVVFSDRFEFVSPKVFGLDERISAEDFREIASFAAIGEYLDRVGLPPETPPGARATEILCGSSQLQEWSERQPAEDSDALQYIRGKIAGSWTADHEQTQFDSADVLRLRVSMRSLRRLLMFSEGDLWNSIQSGDNSVLVTPTSAFFRAEFRSKTSANSLATLLAPPRYSGPEEHWRKCEKFMSVEHLDIANAAKEAICAVEGIARIVTGAHTETLGDQIKRLKRDHNLNAAMAKSLEGLWGFTSSSPGVRHGGATEADITQQEAQYVVETSEAAIRFLLTLDR